MSASSVLALKYRPKDFSQVVGQAHVVRVLEQMLTSNQLHHGFLFSGTRGVGKTSLARLFARCLNCKTAVTPTPCGNCDACQQLLAGSFVDLIEVDAASRTRVEDTRELIDNVAYLPTQGRFKVYLIDEVHMLSTHSFNALLKTLEEPPAHVKFLLATTDPQKLPITVLSRCVHFRLRPLSESDLQAHLAYVLDQESVSYEPNALAPLAQAAQGSVRDALTALEQLVALNNRHVSYRNVCDFLGIFVAGSIEPLLAALQLGDTAKVQEIWHKLLDSGAQPEQILNTLMTELHAWAMKQGLGGQGLNNANKENAQQALLPSDLSSEWIQIAYQALVNAKRDLPFSVNARVCVEMALLRILHFTPWQHLPVSQGSSSSVAQTECAVAQTECALTNQARTSVAQGADISKQRQDVTKKKSETASNTSVAEFNTAVADPVISQSTLAAVTSPTNISVVAEAQQTKAQSFDQYPSLTVSQSLIEQDWYPLDQWVKWLQNKDFDQVSGSLRHILFQLVVRKSKQGFSLHLAPDQHLLATENICAEVEQLVRSAWAERIQIAVEDLTACKISWHWDLDQVDQTAHAFLAQTRADEIQACKRSLADMPLVKALTEAFNAKLDPSSLD